MRKPFALLSLFLPQWLYFQSSVYQSHGYFDTMPP